MDPKFDINDPRWQLILRILQSSLFENSPRLSDFLRYICKLELTGRRNEINEHRIGVEVFGRSPSYNPGEDSIVRSQARFLRQRLDEYFRTIRNGEPLRVSIPKGGYVPLFEEISDLAPLAETSPTSASVSSDLEADLSLTNSPVQRTISRKTMLAAAGLLIFLGVIGVLIIRPKVSSFESPQDRFWKVVFDSHRALMIVPADSTLILIEELTGKPVSLQNYLDRGYLSQIQIPESIKTLSTADLEVSHYTSMADLNLVARLMQVPAIRQSRTEIRYARDLSISDAKQSNLILIGGSRANPWVELFADHMNFYVKYDWATHTNMVVNKAPHKGEAATYKDSSSGPMETVYGLVAFQASLDQDSNALLVAGTNSAGTQSAADFLLSGNALGEFLHQIQRNDGSIPHFELLLEAKSIHGNVPQSTIVTYRILP